MRDALGREINYMRLSVTDRCNLRCRYCMPAEGVPATAHTDILRYEELLRVRRRRSRSASTGSRSRAASRSCGGASRTLSAA